ncbi:hypothetical protein [Nocardia sp. NPDC002869]|uniref:hypothetical protein n=1 Tax=Nocardia sp. NPDC002869 TaxID=3161032 RepID=UPI00398D5E5D
MSNMWAGLDKAVGNMDLGRHSALVEAIETGNADAAAVRHHMIGAAESLVS